MSSVVPGGTATVILNDVFFQSGRIYVSVQGDWWDTIAMRVYGIKRGNEHLMHKLIEANFHLANVSQFPAGVLVFVPDLPVAKEIPLVPWKSTLQLTS